MYELVIAVVGLIGVIATASVGFYKAMLDRRRLDQAYNEIRFQRAALGFPEFVNEWGDISFELVS